jgi:hypothetical protein
METDTIKCPACGAEIPVETHGRKRIARHACLGFPEREVYEETMPTLAQLEKAEKAEAATEKKGKKS